MAITTREFGKNAQGQVVTQYTMTNASGANVKMIDFGATITSICVPDKDGQLADVVLVDGNRDPKIGFPTATIVKGDGKAACIAAASIIAKVTRDRVLDELDKQYPQYGYANHKGYPTKAHYAAIAEHGITEHYRKSFLKTLDKHI